MSPSPKLIVVLGATGLQGGSVLHHILARNTPSEHTFSVRAVTRNPSSANAVELAKLSHVEVVKADLDDKEELKKALEGAWGVFGVSTAEQGPS